ncbi:response regulator transcription factor [Propionicicella superfundia]|uniref:response regulator transcription factor n=1 Tax=Propionicicella superfundia TaxID=348582 RepID=UPI00041569AC|nr:response regulator transcription factor [Propionicicella superfundia]
MARYAGRAPLVLVVEDEPALLGTFTRHLCQQGFDVIEAASIQQARAAVREQPPDIVLLDVLLPDGSGYDLCAELRRMTFAPIIYVTALGQDSAVVRGLAAGGDDYLTKPFSLDVLTARINALLRRAGARATRIELPPLHLDFVTGKVTLEGRPITLSHKEMQLLGYFAANAGRGMTQEELLEVVWDDRSGVPTNTVRQHISNLRRKLRLDAASAFELILTADHRYVFQQVRFTPR